MEHTTVHDTHTYTIKAEKFSVEKYVHNNVCAKLSRFFAGVKHNAAGENHKHTHTENAHIENGRAGWFDILRICCQWNPIRYLVFFLHGGEAVIFCTMRFIDRIGFWVVFKHEANGHVLTVITIYLRDDVPHPWWWFFWECVSVEKCMREMWYNERSYVNRAAFAGLCTYDIFQWSRHFTAERLFGYLVRMYRHLRG